MATLICTPCLYDDTHQLVALQRLARSSTIGEYSRSLSDVSKWSRSVSSIDEAQLDVMRKHLRNGQSGKSPGNHTQAVKGSAANESRSDM